jgi:(2R)-sulfolactate sulfo-lyase subunit alpha
MSSNTQMVGWIMEEDKTLNLTTISDIPIGHKVALKDLETGDTIIKYGVDIGRVVAPIKAGEHLHVHNVKTKRW